MWSKPSFSHKLFAIFLSLSLSQWVTDLLVGLLVAVRKGQFAVFPCSELESNLYDSRYKGTCALRCTSLSLSPPCLEWPTRVPRASIPYTDKIDAISLVLERSYLIYHSVRLWKARHHDVSIRAAGTLQAHCSSDYQLHDQQYWFVPCFLPQYNSPEQAQLWPEILPADLHQVGRVYRLSYIPFGFFDHLLLAFLQLPDCHPLSLWKSGAIISSPEHEMALVSLDLSNCELTFRFRVR